MKHLYVKSFFCVCVKYSEKWQNHAKICILHQRDNLNFCCENILGYFFNLFKKKTGWLHEATCTRQCPDSAPRRGVKTGHMTSAERVLVSGPELLTALSRQARTILLRVAAERAKRLSRTPRRETESNHTTWPKQREYYNRSLEDRSVRTIITAFA